jgi:hypothetical protein
MEAKLLAFLALACALIGSVWWYGEHKYSQGHAAGAAEIQSQWDTDKLAIQKVADAAIAEATKDKEEALSNNSGVINDLTQQLDSARGLNTQLADRLRAYQATRPAAGGVPESRGRPGIVAAPAAPGVGELNVALGDALDECYANYAKYSALIKELTPQL